jgi:ABC-type transport system involved in multi-copper enzyme maturation permease subunit
MTALLQAELLKLRTTRTFAVLVGTAALLSVGLVGIAASMSVHDDPRSLFTNTSVTYFIVLLGAIGMTGEWRHRTITGTVLAAPDRLRLLAAKALSYSAAGVVLSLLVTVATMLVGTLILSSRGDATLGAGGLLDVLWRNLAVAALLGPLGVCVGALVRNQVVTVIGLVVVAAALEPPLLSAVPEVGRFGPLFGAPDGILRGTEAGLLAAGPALVVLLAWIALAFVAAGARLRRRDLV